MPSKKNTDETFRLWWQGIEDDIAAARFEDVEFDNPRDYDWTHEQWVEYWNSFKKEKPHMLGLPTLRHYIYGTIITACIVAAYILFIRG
tara:strand:- start:553 stop:819 length:267 start_codon:yes stop_codon:yes gene_type:complete